MERAFGGPRRADFWGDARFMAEALERERDDAGIRAERGEFFAWFDGKILSDRIEVLSVAIARRKSINTEITEGGAQRSQRRRKN
jgi:hypothetical protein